MIAALTFMLALFVPLISAQTQPAAGSQPAAAQDPAKEEYDAYTAWYTAYKAQDTAKSLELGKAFVEKFPNSKYTDFIKKDNVRVRGVLFNKAVQEKNMNEMIRIGKDVLADDPDNLDYLLAMSIQIRQNELFATPPNFAHAAEAADFTAHTIRLIEAGKTPTGAKDFDKNKTLAFFHWSLAVIDDHNQGADKAMEHYMEAAKLDPMNATYYFNCGRLHHLKYIAAAKKYSDLPQADRDAAPAEMKPEVKGTLDNLNKEADAVINCWARFMGLTATEGKGWESTRPQVEKVVTELYKYRHNDSTEGLQKLVDQNKGATPVNMTPPSEAPATSSNPAGAATSPAKTPADQGAMSSKPAAGAPAKANTAPAKPNGKKPRR
jgi:tetratricopeptide (TPR) repeat protein